jgi:hypothetical protein
MLINCDTCTARHVACAGCVVHTLLMAPPVSLDLDEAEWNALDALTTAGMLPRVVEVAAAPAAAGDVRRVTQVARRRRAG